MQPTTHPSRMGDGSALQRDFERAKRPRDKEKETETDQVIEGIQGVDSEHDQYSWSSHGGRTAEEKVEKQPPKYFFQKWIHQTKVHQEANHQGLWAFEWAKMNAATINAWIQCLVPGGMHTARTRGDTDLVVLVQAKIRSPMIVDHGDGLRPHHRRNTGF